MNEGADIKPVSKPPEKKREERVQSISHGKLLAALQKFPSDQWVEIGYIKVSGEVVSMNARLVTEGDPANRADNESGTWVGTGVDKPQFVKLKNIAYIRGKG